MERTTTTMKVTSQRPRNGYVEYETPKGVKFAGHLKDGKKHGEAKITYADESRFEGVYNEGKKEGRGKFWTAAGEFYDGEFQDSHFDGWGFYKWENGEVYAGQWNKGVQEGFGIQIWPKDSQYYAGEWKQGKKDGYGIHMFPSGGNYKGWWRDNSRHGYVCYTFPDNEVSMGMWEDGKEVLHFKHAEEAKEDRDRCPEIPLFAEMPEWLMEDLINDKGSKAQEAIETAQSMGREDVDDEDEKKDEEDDMPTSTGEVDITKKTYEVTTYEVRRLVDETDAKAEEVQAETEDYTGPVRFVPRESS